MTGFFLTRTPHTYKKQKPSFSECSAFCVADLHTIDPKEMPSIQRQQKGLYSQSGGLLSV